MQEVVCHEAKRNDERGRYRHHDGGRHEDGKGEEEVEGEAQSYSAASGTLMLLLLVHGARANRGAPALSRSLALPPLSPALMHTLAIWAELGRAKVS